MHRDGEQVRTITARFQKGSPDSLVGADAPDVRVKFHLVASVRNDEGIVGSLYQHADTHRACCRSRLAWVRNLPNKRQERLELAAVASEQFSKCKCRVVA